MGSAATMISGMSMFMLTSSSSEERSRRVMTSTERLMVRRARFRLEE